MRFDVYIKVVLTIIALSLTLGWVRNINFAYPVHAESGMEQAEIYAGVGEDERVQRSLRIRLTTLSSGGSWVTRYRAGLT